MNILEDSRIVHDLNSSSMLQVILTKYSYLYHKIIIYYCWDQRRGENKELLEDLIEKKIIDEQKKN